MRRLLNLRFFDGTAGYGEMSDEDFQNVMDSVRYAGFDEDDPAPVPVPADDDAGNGDDSGGGESTPVQNEPPAAPAAEPEVPPAQPEPPAQQSGIPPHLADRYAPIIDALETDPSFRQALADAIAARRSSAYVPAAAPQPEQAAKPADEDVEPVCGEDELLEDFERRHGEWERRQQDKRVRAEVEKALSERQEAFQREQFIRRSQTVNELVQQDTEAPAVASFIQKNPAPARLMQLMNEDPDVFMYVYDGMRQIVGKGNYFKEIAMRQRGVPTTQPAAAPSQSAAQPSADRSPAAVPVRTHVKTPQAPFTENGGVSSKGGGGGGVSFAEMSDKEFASYMKRVSMQGL